VDTSEPKDNWYMELRHRLQHSTGTGMREQDLDYHLTTEGLVRFRDKIYVQDDNELNKFLLKEFHVKPYSCHQKYNKTFKTVKKFYYWLTMKKEVEEFMVIFLDCQ